MDCFFSARSTSPSPPLSHLLPRPSEGATRHDATAVNLICRCRKPGTISVGCRPSMAALFMSPRRPYRLLLLLLVLLHLRVRHCRKRPIGTVLLAADSNVRCCGRRRCSAASEVSTSSLRQHSLAVWICSFGDGMHNSWMRIA
jgi:hypothetical protein